MTRWYSVEEALELLKSYYVTSSKQMVTRWLREGKIVGSLNENRKEGWRIHESDLEEFFERMRPGLKKLFSYSEKLEQLKEQVNELKMGSNPVDSVQETSGIEEWKAQIQSSQKQNELLLTQVEFLIKQNQELQEKNGILQKDCSFLLEEKIQWLDEKKKLLLEEQLCEAMKRGTSKSEKKQVSQDILEKKQEVKLTLSDFKQALIKCSDSEWNEQQQKKLYHYFVKQIFNDDGELKEEMKGEDQKYYCDFVSKEYDKWMPFIKCKIKQFLSEGISNQILNEG